MCHGEIFVSWNRILILFIRYYNHIQTKANWIIHPCRDMNMRLARSLVEVCGFHHFKRIVCIWLIFLIDLNVLRWIYGTLCLPWRNMFYWKKHGHLLLINISDINIIPVIVWYAKRKENTKKTMEIFDGFRFRIQKIKN